MLLYDLAVVGAGSAAAYYLSTVDKNIYRTIICIGDEDPWAGARGLDEQNPNNPVNFINHTPPMIEHFGDKVPAYTETLYKRSDFAAANANIVRKHAEKFVACRIVKITEGVLPVELQGSGTQHRGFCLELNTAAYSGGNLVYARRVVAAGGAGAHSVPNEAAVAHRQFPQRVMDMDQFARQAGKIPKTNSNHQVTTVFVLGPNAAVDTVETALFQGFKVVWFFGDSVDAKTDIRTVQKPAILATGHQVYAMGQEQGHRKNDLHFLRGSMSVKASPVDVHVLYKAAGDNSFCDIKGDYFVYGVGQATTKQEEEAGKLFEFIDKSLTNRLVPLYDTNQRFGAAHETVLGFQLDRTPEEEVRDPRFGLEVVGAMAAQVLKLRKDIPHNYLRELEKRIKEVMDIYMDNLRYDDEYPPRMFELPLDTVAKWPPDQLSQAYREMGMRLAHVDRRLKNPVAALKALLSNYITLKNFFVKHPDVTLGDLGHVAAQSTPSVIQSPQLGAIRAGTAAQNGFIPEYVGTEDKRGQANFSADDRTMLRVYIAANYPFVSEENADEFIRYVLAERTKKGYGFTPQEIDNFNHSLKFLDRIGERALVN
ncbi:MAG: hypothetical protein ACREQE_04625 [Candidatus Binataceae bacterium]